MHLFTLKNKKWYWLVIVSAFLYLCSCTNLSHHEGEKHILVMWPTDPSDRVYQQWTSQLTDSFERAGIDAKFHTFFAYQFEDSARRALCRFKCVLRRARQQGRYPDLILAHGDYLCDLLLSDENGLNDSIPAICYGLNTANRKLPKHNVVRIFDAYDVKENLEFADYILNLHPNNDSLRYWMGSQPRHRFCTLIDPEASPEDARRFKVLRADLFLLDSPKYYDNFYNDTEEDTLEMLNDAGTIIFSCRSIKNPLFNCTTMLSKQISNKWTFYPQMSPNCFMQVKHDDASRSCVDGPNFMPYFTMVAEDYLTNDSCIGGYISPFDMQLRDVVDVSKRIFAGESLQQMHLIMHKHCYCINWKVLRSKGLSLEQIPSYVRIDNVQFRDRHHQWYLYIVLISLASMVFLLINAVFYIHKAVKNRNQNSELYRQQALQAIQNNEILNYTLKSTGAISWNDSGNNYTLLNRMKLNAYYLEKLTAFLQQTVDGRYSMQLQGSFDDQPIHWYELLMNVKHEKLQVKRQGILVIIDVQKEQEKKFIEAHRLLMNTQMREGFVASMGHEVRTPLNAIVGYAQVLAMPGFESTPEELHEYAEVIDSNVAILKKMINDMLLVTLMNNSTLSAQCTRGTTAELIQSKNWPDAMSYLQRRHNNLRFQSEFAGTTLNVDPKLFHVVIENLLINASKFSSEGSTITIGWGLVDLAEEGNKVEVWVKDEGSGISADQMQMIFDRFYKVDSYVPGCGLGLYISKCYVELMGGTISVESELGKGSTFKIVLER